MIAFNTPPRALGALALSFALWPMLGVASWIWFPLPVAALSSAVYLSALVVTGWPALIFLCRAPVVRGGGGSGFLFPALDGDPFESSFPDRDEATGRPDRLTDSCRTTLRDPGSLLHEVNGYSESGLPQFRVDKAGVRLIAEGCSSLDFPTYWRLVPELSPEDLARSGFTLTRPGDDVENSNGAGGEAA